VQGLRDAKALLDEGILTQEEFLLEMEKLFKQREKRVAERPTCTMCGFGIDNGTCKCDELVWSAEAFLAPELGGLPMYNAVCAIPEEPR
jgi:hypothetical protein